MICYNGRLVSYGERWYDEDSDAAPHGADILIWRQRGQPLPGANNVESHSLYTDLAEHADRIFAGFHKTYRARIRRAESKDQLVYESYEDPMPVMSEFCRFYDDFAAQKGIWPADRKWLEGAAARGHLLLSCARLAGHALVWHAYLVWNRIARLEYSASCFRDKNADYKALVARANRWLHWQNILRFQTRGFSTYDWGGIFPDESTPEREGINRFKKGFGGTEVVRYDCTVALTLAGRLFLPLRTAWHRMSDAKSRPLAPGANEFTEDETAVQEHVGKPAVTQNMMASR